MFHAKERFSFTNHLVSATLLQADKFEEYTQAFPTAALNATVAAHPMLNKVKLKTELSLIYESAEIQGCRGALALYETLHKYNFQEPFSETLDLLNILITTPMTTAEAERCFSTLKRIKNFLRNTMGQERLNALAMLAMERELVKKMPDFNERAIDHFAALKERRSKIPVQMSTMHYVGSSIFILFFYVGSSMFVSVDLGGSKVSRQSSQ